MITPFVVALGLVLGAQESAPPPPSAPPSAPPIDEPPVVPLAPPPPSSSPPPPAKPAPSPKPDAKHAPDEAKAGLDPLATGLVQLAAGGGACCVGGTIALVPCFGLGLIPGLAGLGLGVGSFALVTGVAVGGTEALVGDAFGQERSAMVWPIVAGVVPVGAMSAVIFGTGAYLAAHPALGNGLQVQNPTPAQQQQLVQQLGALPWIIAAAIVVGPVVTVAAPTAVYALTGVEKKPGDTGQGFPGFFTPANPPPAATKRIVVAMAY